MFITPDSIVQNPFDPQTLNRYAYARNNPLTYTDPSGHIFLVDDILIGAALGAAIGGSFSAITGGDIGKGILTGAMSGAMFGLAGGYAAGVNELAAISNSTFQVEMAGVSLLQQTALHATAGAVSGGINAAITGGNIGFGALTGGLSSGVANYSGGVLPQYFAVQFAARTAVGGLTGGVTAALYGRGFRQGFLYGSGSAAYGYMCNDFLHDILRGTSTALREGWRAGKYSISETGKALYDIAEEGPLLAKAGLAVAAVSVTAPVAYSAIPATNAIWIFLGEHGAQATVITAFETAVDIVAPNPPETVGGMIYIIYERLTSK